MGKNYSELFARFTAGTIVIVLLGTFGCQKKDNSATSDQPREQLKNFSFQRFSEKIDVGITGASAEVSSDRDTATIKEPVISLKSEDSSIEITTGSEGRAEIRLMPKNQGLQEAILEGQVRIVQKEIKTGQIAMEARCGKLTYQDKQKLLVMEQEPIIRRQQDSFSGEKILYYWLENKIEIKGKVNVLIHPEKRTNP